MVAKSPSEAPFTPSFLAVKLVDIGLTTTYFFVTGLVFAKLFDLFYGKFNAEDYKQKNIGIVFLEILFHLFLIGVVAYGLRNLVGLVPYPLDGVAGFEHKRLKELSGGTALSMIMLFFQRNLRDKIEYFAERVLGIQASTTAKATNSPTNPTKSA
jgi:hypothetical protein